MNVNPDQCDFSLRPVSAVKMVAGTEKAKERPPPGPGASRPVLLFILVLFPREEKTGSLHFATWCVWLWVGWCLWGFIFPLFQTASGHWHRCGLRGKWPEQGTLCGVGCLRPRWPYLSSCSSSQSTFLWLFFIVIRSFGLGIQKHLVASDSWESKGGASRVLIPSSRPVLLGTGLCTWGGPDLTWGAWRDTDPGPSQPAELEFRVCPLGPRRWSGTWAFKWGPKVIPPQPAWHHTPKPGGLTKQSTNMYLLLRVVALFQTRRATQASGW